MASPDEIKVQRHAELAQEHKRKAAFHENFAGKQPDTASVGSGVGSFFSALGEHKFILIGGIAVVIVIVIAIGIVKGNQSNNNTANQQGDYSASGIMTSNISTALDSINASIEALGTQLQNQPPTPTPNPGNPPNPPKPPKPPKPPHPNHTTHVPPTNTGTTWKWYTVQKWPNKGSTLWGIAQLNGISLQRIEQLNPNIPNFNLIYPGQKVRIS